MQSKSSYIEVEAKGLINKVVGPGGETTGWSITCGKFVWELDFKRNKTWIDLAQKLNGKRTPGLAKGILKLVSGPERIARIVITVGDFKVGM